MRLATAVAEESPHSRWRLGCVVARGSSVIAKAFNVPKNDPRILEGGPGTTVHAEAHALRKLTYQADRAEGAVLYVVRVSKFGKRRLARPCLSCYKAIHLAGVKSIVYSMDVDGDFGIERLP